MFPPPPQPPIRIKAVSQVRSHSAILCGAVKPAEDCVPAGGRTGCRHGWTLHWAGRATRPTSDQRSIVSLLQYSLSAVLHLGKPGLQCAGAPVRQSNNSYHFPSALLWIILPCNQSGLWTVASTALPQLASPASYVWVWLFHISEIS